MNKPFQFLALALIIALFLLGGVFTLTQSASAMSGMLYPQSPQATVLTVTISDMVLPVGESKMLDLLDYTTYDGDPSALVYTITQNSASQSYMTVGLSGTHHLTMTAISDITPRYATIDVEVSDGDLSSSERFEIELNKRPVLDFFPGGLNQLPNPFIIHAGIADVLHLVDSQGERGDPIYLEYFTDDYEDGLYGNYGYTVRNTPPLSLGIEITFVNDAHYVIFYPTEDTIGNYPVEIEVTDSDGLTDTDVFTVAVYQSIYLPEVRLSYPPIVTISPIDNPENDGRYYVSWTGTGTGAVATYELQYATSPDFSNATTIETQSNSRYVDMIAPATYYWRIRVQAPAGMTYPWSNVQSTRVDNLAYLYVKPLCAYGLRIEVYNGGAYFVEEYDTSYCNTWDYWRAIPVGNYATRLTWLGGNIVDNVPTMSLGNHEYCIEAGAASPTWGICD